MGGVLAFSLFISCEKDKLRTVESNTLKEDPSLRAVLDSEALPHIMAGADPWEISHDQTLNNMAAVSLDLFLGQSKYNQWIINNAALAANHCVSVSSFINYAETIATPDEMLILEQLDLLANAADLNYPRYTNNLSFGYDVYVPAIFVPELSSRDANKLPRISGGVEMSDLIIGYEDYENHIIAYREAYGPADRVDPEEFFMNESDLMGMDNPLFVFDNAEPALLTAPPVQYTQPHSTASSSSFAPHDYDYKEYKIKTRHEKDSRSEVHIVGAHYNLSSNSTYAGAGYFLKKNSTYKEDLRIRKIHKDNVNKEFNKWTRMVLDVWTPYSENPIVWNVFEQDWAKSRKSMAEVTVATGKKLTILGNTKYKHQWFLFDTYSENTNSILEQNFIYWNWAKRYSSKNGEMKVWRVGA